MNFKVFYWRNHTLVRWIKLWWIYTNKNSVKNIYGFSLIRICYCFSSSTCVHYMIFISVINFNLSSSIFFVLKRNIIKKIKLSTESSIFKVDSNSFSILLWRCRYHHCFCSNVMVSRKLPHGYSSYHVYFIRHSWSRQIRDIETKLKTQKF